MNKFKYFLKDLKWFVNPYYWIYPYYLSFVEEVIMNPDYFGHLGGRVEVWTQWSPYDVDEYRFFTNKTKEFYLLRDKYEFKNMTIWGLRKFKKMLENNYHEHIL